MAKFVPRLEVFNNTLSPLVSRGQGLSFETLKLVAASFRESKGKSFDECWVHSAQDLLHWPAACSNIFLSYFEMFNRGVTKGDTATGGSKPATLSTGAVIKVPLFVSAGEVVTIDTRNGEYQGRK